MPAPVAVLVIWNTQVEIGPRTALAKVGAIQICGFFMMLLNCSMEVPIP